MHVTTRMNLDNKMLREEAGHKRSQVVSFHFYEVSRISKSTETEHRLVIPGVGGSG